MFLCLPTNKKKRDDAERGGGEGAEMGKTCSATQSELFIERLSGAPPTDRRRQKREVERVERKRKRG